MKWYTKLILPILAVVIWEIAAVLVNNPYILPRVEEVFAVFLHGPTIKDDKAVYEFKTTIGTKG